MKNWLVAGLLVIFAGRTDLFAQKWNNIFPEADRIKAAGVSLHSLPAVHGTFFYGKSGKAGAGIDFLAQKPAPQKSSAATGNLLPKWTPDSLPFFCRVEHDCGKKLPFAFKFRLGSVEYVDRLEGKSIWLGE